MTTPVPTPDSKESIASPSPRHRRELALAGIGLLALLGFAWAVQGWRPNGDRAAVTARALEVEQHIRAHGADLWWSVEGSDPPGRKDQQLEARHQRILHDFERLAHLQDFAMADISVHLGLAEASVGYAVRGRALVGDPPAPARGEMTFRKEGSNWRLVDHRLIEAR